MAVLSLSRIPHNTTRQCFVNNGCTEYYETPTDGLIADARSAAEWVGGETDMLCT